MRVLMINSYKKVEDLKLRNKFIQEQLKLNSELKLKSTNKLKSNVRNTNIMVVKTSNKIIKKKEDKKLDFKLKNEKLASLLIKEPDLNKKD